MSCSKKKLLMKYKFTGYVYRKRYHVKMINNPPIESQNLSEVVNAHKDSENCFINDRLDIDCVIAFSVARQKMC